jgi:hypothetical protein
MANFKKGFLKLSKKKQPKATKILRCSTDFYLGTT